MTPDQLATPWVESPFFASILREKALPADEEALARQYHERGFAVLENLVSEEEARTLVAQVAPLYPDLAEGPRSRFRLQDAWRESPAVARLAAHPRVLETLQLLYGRRPFPFQTLNFPRGSQQAGHSDQLHFSSLPARFMCGVWVALEDISPDNGPLFYHPGSHRLPEYDLDDLRLAAEPPDYAGYERVIAALMRELEIPREELLVKRGTALIWSSNIVHGGAPIGRPGATRHSQVTHYYFEGCLFYTPLHSRRSLGEYQLREHVTDIRSGAEVKQTWNGLPFRARSLGSGRKRIELAEPVPLLRRVERKLRQVVEDTPALLGAARRVRRWRKRTRL